MPPCPAATSCSDAGGCSTHVSDGEVAALLSIVLLPIALSLWLPALLRRAKGDGGDLNACGVTVPRACATSGLLVIVVVMAVGFVPTFALLLTSAHPCHTALGACGSISCACGNFYEDGYVWMMWLLATAAVLVVREAAALPVPPGHPRAARLRCVLVLGALAIVCTGVYPEHFSLDPTDTNRFYAIAYGMHGFGLLVALSALVIAPFCWLACAARRLPPARRAPAVALRAVHVAGLLTYMAAFGLLHRTADVSDYCAPIGGAAACEAWPALPPAACARLGHLRGGRGHRLPASYTCAWLNNTLSEVERLLYPPAFAAAAGGACRKSRCDLYANARSVALEFGALLLFASYVTTYAVRDTGWVLGLPVLAEVGGAEARRALVADEVGGGAPVPPLVHEAVPVARPLAPTARAAGGVQGLQHRRLEYE